MNQSTFGPWATTLESSGTAPLSTFWTNRLHALPHVSAGRGVSRRQFLAIGAAGLAACGLPTLLGITATAQNTDGQTPAEESPARIYIQMSLSGDDDSDSDWSGLVSVDPETGELHRLIPEGHSHRVSPDRQTVAYAHDDAVWTNNLAGNAPGKIADFGGRPLWTPDGKWIIVTDSNLNDEDKKEQPEKPVWTNQTWKMDVFGGNRVPLDIPDTDSVHDISPDGEWFVTDTDRHPPYGRGYQLYLMRPDGSEQRRLTRGRGLNVYARFSPDGKQIVYVYQRRGEGTNVYIVNVDGTDARNITRRSDIGPQACFSPDGRHLAVALHNWPVTAEGGQRLEDRSQQADYRIEILDTGGENWRRLNLPAVTFLGHPQWI